MSTEEINQDLIGMDEDKEEIEIQDPIELALHGKKFTRVSLEEIEKVSTHEQSKYTRDPY